MQSKFIQINSTKYHYLEHENHGKPKFVLLHGLATECHYWDKIAALLSKDYHLIIPDLKGHGKTEWGKAYKTDYAFTLLKDELHLLLSKLAGEPFYLMGHSYGGQLAMVYAAHYPGSVRKLLVLDSSAKISVLGSMLLLFVKYMTPKDYKDKETLIKNLTRSVKDIDLVNYTVNNSFKQLENGRMVSNYDKKNISPNNVADYKLHESFLIESMKKIETQTAFIYGEKSQIMNRRIVELNLKLLKNSAPFMIKGSSHHMVFSHTAELEAIIRKFIG